MKNLITDLQKLVAMPGTTWMHLNNRLETYMDIRAEYADRLKREDITPFILNWLNGQIIESAITDIWLPLEERVDGALLEFFGFAPYNISLWKFRVCQIK